MVKTLEITLSDDLERRVDEAVNSGAFTSPEHAITSAVAAGLSDQNDNLGYTIAELRKLAEEGRASGPGRGWTAEEIKAEGRRRLAATHDG